MRKRKNQNLTKEENAVLREIARQHGYLVTRGPTAKGGANVGNPVGLLLAIISGEVATVLMEDDDRPYAIRKLRETGDPILDELANNLQAAEDIRQRLERDEVAEYLEDR